MTGTTHLGGRDTAAAGILAAVFLALAAACPVWARAQPDQPPAAAAPADLFDLPSGALAWCAFDPRTFRAGDGLDPLGVLIHRGLAACIIDLPPLQSGADGPLAPVPRLLDLLRNEVHPFRVALLDLGAEPAPEGGAMRSEPSLRVTRLGAVVEVFVEGAAGAQLAAAAREAAPGGAVREETGRVVIGLSHEGPPGAPAILERWVAARGVRADQTQPWDGHRARASAAAGVPDGVARGTPVAEAWIDLNAIRRAMPEAFTGTPLHRVLRDWRLINARSVMVHVHRVEPGAVRIPGGGEQGYRHAPLLAVELTCSARSEPRDRIHAIPIARAEWPADATARGLAPRDGAYALLMRAEWGTWLRAVLGTYRSAGTAWDELARSTRIAAWEKKHSAAGARLAQAAAGWVLAWAHEGSSLMILAPLKYRPPASPDADVAEISGTIDPAVKFDDARKCWTVNFEAIGINLTWSHAEGALLLELKPSQPDEPRP